MLTKSQYAQRCGKSRQYISRLTAEGVITVNQDGLIDAAVADREMRENRCGFPNNGHGGGRRKKKPKLTAERLGKICADLFHWIGIAAFVAAADENPRNAEGWLRQGIKNALVELNSPRD